MKNQGEAVELGPEPAFGACPEDGESNGGRTMLVARTLGAALQPVGRSQNKVGH